MNNPTSGTRAGLLLFGICFAVGVVLAALILARGAEKVKLTDRKIQVTGYAVRQVNSDVADWNLSVSARDAELPRAYIQLQDSLEKTFGYLERAGIPRNNLAVFQVFTTTHYKMTNEGIQTNEIQAYVVRQDLGIRSTDVHLIQKLSRDCTSLIKDGVQITSQNPKYFWLFSQLCGWSKRLKMKTHR